MKNKSVIKHSATIQITNRITLLQRKTFNVLLANAYYDLPDKNIFQITEQDLWDILKIKTRNRKHLQEILLGLVTCAIEFNYLGKDNKHAWRASSLLADANIDSGVCTYEYSSFLRNILYKPEIYAKISLSLQNKFSSKHSLALYELAVDYYIDKQEYGFTPFISLDEFRALMGLEDNQYSKFTDLNRYIIKQAITEINEQSDLQIEVKYKREARKIQYLQFKIRRNPNKKTDKSVLTGLIQSIEPILAEQTLTGLVQPTEPVLAEQTIKSITQLKVGIKTVQKAIAQYGIEGVAEIRDYAISQDKAGKEGKGKPVRNISKLLSACLNNGWGLKTPEERQAEKDKAILAEKNRQELKTAHCFLLNFIRSYSK